MSVRYLIRSLLHASLLVVCVSQHVLAQSPSVRPREVIFQEDSKQARDDEAARKERILKADGGEAAPGDEKEFDIEAPSIEILKDSNEVKGSGGVVISGGGSQAQAEEGVMNLETKSANLKGSVFFSGNESGSISSDEAFVNFEDETGQFKNAKFVYDEDGYSISGRDVYKLSETRYKLFDASFTTCHCEDGVCPWSIDADETTITREGYAHAWDTTLRFHGVPVFYTPYLAFPAKLERASGLLAPTYGFGGKDGFQFKQPIYLALDDTYDLTISPFIESKTRNGAQFDFRQAVSTSNNVRSRWYYSNERPRDGDLRGIRKESYLDPSIDDDRLGVYYNQVWRAQPDSILPFRIVADVHHVSDNLMVREMDDPLLADASDRYTTSTVAARSTFGDYVTGEIFGEFNQDLYREQDIQLQRLPEASLSGSRSFYPFGYNPYGVKVVGRTTVTGTQFAREEGYDGFRTDVNPSLTVPFHYKNYANAYIQGGYRHTSYKLDETLVPALSASGSLLDKENWLELDESRSRNLPYFTTGLSTSFERVDEVAEGGLISYLSSIGADSQVFRLARTKHVVEPFVRYTLVPDVDQSDLPRFDSLDRVRERQLMVAGVSMSLLGRYVPRRASEAGIAELTPEIDQLPALSGGYDLGDLGEADGMPSLTGPFEYRSGEIRELMDLTIKQGYDFAIAEDVERDPPPYPATDVNVALGLYPSKYLSLKVDTNYNAQESRNTSWGTQLRLYDDRRDSVWTRFSWIDPVTYQDPVVSQIDGGLELVLTERMKFGLFTRFDERESLFIRNKMALRFLSACNCWYMDVGFADKANPDTQEAFVTFTFTGLGDISQNFGLASGSTNGQ